MLNPDGMIMGNYRTRVSGRDLNRQFLVMNSMLFPTVEAIKDLVVMELKNKKHQFFFNK